MNFGYYNIDCMEGLKQIPDKYIDLAIVDPPYGDAGCKFQNGERFGERFDRYKKIDRRGGQWASKYEKKIVGWDNAPPPEYFDELFRVSRFCIIWGGIISIYRQREISLYGGKSQYLKRSQWQCVNMPGRIFRVTLKFTKQLRKERRTTRGFTRHKSQSLFTSGC